MKKSIITLLGMSMASASVFAQVPADLQNSVIPNHIDSDLTLEAGQEYVLDGYTFVMPGYSLTIEPGVRIYGMEENGAAASALVVTRGAQIFAQGSATDPIVFEPISARDADLDYDYTGMWGGVIILGDAVLNSNKDGSWEGDYPTQDVEGMLPETDDQSLINYGGSNDEDNSGVFSYVSIRHAGIVISEGNEINGLTLGGVGSGTTINHVEVFANKDDAIEIFGGTVNLDHIVAAFSYDDSLDLDEGYRGSIQNYFVLQGKYNNPDGSTADKGDRGGEWDGADSPNDGTPLMLVKLANATFMGLGADDSNTAINIRANGAAEVYNSVFVDYQTMIRIDATRKVEDDSGNEQTVTDESQTARFNDGDIVFAGNVWYGASNATQTAEGLFKTGESYLHDYDFLTGNDNQIADPGLTVNRTPGEATLDVTPAPDSVAVTSTLATLPSEFEQTTYKGAFETYYNWATGWTKLYEDGYFVEEGTWFDHPSWGWIYLDSGSLDAGTYVYFKSTDQWIWVASLDDSGYWTYLFK